MFNRKQQSAFLLPIIAFSLFTLQSCVKEIDEYDSTNSGQVTDMQDLQAPVDFNFNLDKEIALELYLKTNNDDPIPGVRVNIMTDIPENNGEIIFTGITGQNGEIDDQFRISSTLSKVIINTDFAGIPNNAEILLQNSKINVTLGGSSPQKIKYVDAIKNGNFTGTNNFKTAAVPPFSYLGTWTSLGLPNYLTTPNDVINSTFLTRINYSLPDKRSVPAYHPQYIDPNTESNIKLTQSAAIYMTFVHENTSLRNVIGYYAYNKNNPPASVNNIPSIKIVFPNLSYTNSGGGLTSGNKVYLGTFGPDTVIGFVMMANGYKTTNFTVSAGTAQFYSIDSFNPETSPLKQAHNAVLWDSLENKFVIGFEDVNRSTTSDEDFNDAILYISSNPSNAISKQNMARTSTPSDSDGDGVNDIFDDYPFDIDRATNNYYPGVATFGYLAFEDLWPFRGDYDMNDMLVGYRFNTIKNTAGKIKEIQSKIFVKAAGGSYQHGFGFEIPVPPSFVQNVSGLRITENYISLAPNGTENGQTKAVAIAFDNSSSLVQRPVGYYVNTEPGSPVVISDTVNVSVSLISPIKAATIGTAPFNPFLISNKRRGYEIHLADKAPTNLADASLFNTGQDRSNAALNRYYKTENNLPWCLNIPGNFAIVVEKSQIMKAYLRFSNWVWSGGRSYTDWYMDKPGYRDVTKILNR